MYDTQTKGDILGCDLEKIILLTHYHNRISNTQYLSGRKIVGSFRKVDKKK